MPLSSDVSLQGFSSIADLAEFVSEYLRRVAVGFLRLVLLSSQDVSFSVFLSVFLV